MEICFIESETNNNNDITKYYFCKGNIYGNQLIVLNQIEYKELSICEIAIFGKSINKSSKILIILL